MRKPLAFIALAVLASVVLAATVFREQVAYAAQVLNATIVGPLDGSGNVRVHEQGTANVNVTNSAVTVAPQAADIRSFGLLSAGPSGSATHAFPPIDASLITLTGMEGQGGAIVQNGGFPILFYATDEGDVVLPLSQPMTVDAFVLNCGSTSCRARINVVGRLGL